MSDLFQKAANQGHAQAQYYLACIADSPSQAKDLFAKAAIQGHAMSQFRLGLYYSQGRVVPQDHTASVRWYTLAANQGNAMAQNNLGVMHRKGLGTPRNYLEAIDCFANAAKQGNCQSQFNLSLMYGFGEGLPVNIAVARKWYELALGNGFEPTIAQRLNYLFGWRARQYHRLALLVTLVCFLVFPGDLTLSLLLVSACVTIGVLVNTIFDFFGYS